MDIKETHIKDLVVIKPQVFGDSRGYFFESYNQGKFQAAGIELNFIQDNQSLSKYGTLRGLHFQKGAYAQTKLVRAVKGAILDVAVDLRKGSKTFGQHYAVELTEDNYLQLLIPKGFAHGFSVLSETAIVNYKCDALYAPQAEGGIIYNDPDLKIDWKIPADKVLLSDKDKKYPQLKDISDL